MSDSKGDGSGKAAGGAGAGFTVTDRRSFTDGSEPKPQGRPSEDRSGPGTDEPGRREPVGEPGAGAAEPDAAGALPAVDFHTFILSLGSSTLLHLGELDHPDSGQPQKDLALAKHTIEILAMLKEKTKGNLTSAEDKLMDSLLYDLRLRFVSARK